MPLTDYYALCQSLGVSHELAKKWLIVFQRQNLILHFHAAKNPPLAQTLILRPDSEAMQKILFESLDVHETQLDAEIARSKIELERLIGLKEKHEAIHGEIEAHATRVLVRYKWLGFLTLNAQFGFLGYLVWGVESWDVMEPITYFIGFTGALAWSTYFSFTKMDATWSNMWKRMFEKRVNQAYCSKKLDPKYRLVLRQDVLEQQEYLNSIQQMKRSPDDNGNGTDGSNTRCAMEPCKYF